MFSHCCGKHVGAHSWTWERGTSDRLVGLLELDGSVQQPSRETNLTLAERPLLAATFLAGGADTVLGKRIHTWVDRIPLVPAQLDTKSSGIWLAYKLNNVHTAGKNECAYLQFIWLRLKSHPTYLYKNLLSHYGLTQAGCGSPSLGCSSGLHGLLPYTFSYLHSPSMDTMHFFWMKLYIHLVEVRTLTLVLSPFFRTVCIWWCGKYHLPRSQTAASCPHVVLWNSQHSFSNC